MWSCLLKVALMFGSHATGICEPCQVGNEAALSRTFRCREGAWAELTAKVTFMERVRSVTHEKKNAIVWTV